MKAMKKTMALLLAVVMALSLAGMAFATDPNATWNGTDYGDGNTNTFDATASVDKADGTLDETAVYCVDIAWTMTSGAYTSASDIYKWSPSDMKYVKDSAKIGDTLTQSSAAGVSITVTNKSNAKVAYAVSYASAKDNETAISAETITNSSATSGTLESAAPAAANIVLTDSPDDTVGTGTATTATYTATVALAKDDNGDYIATQAAAGNLTMGTYTVAISKPAAGVNLKVTRFEDCGGSVNAYYSTDNGTTWTEITGKCDLGTATQLKVKMVRTARGMSDSDDILYAFVTDESDLQARDTYTNALLFSLGTAVFEEISDNVVFDQADYGKTVGLSVYIGGDD